MKKLPDNAGRNSWKVGRRVIEYDCLFSGLKFGQSCLLGPVPLTYESVVGELKECLVGYRYVMCSNTDFGTLTMSPMEKHPTSQNATCQAFL